MWPDSTFISMFLVALVLFIFLVWPIGVDLHHLWVKRRLRKQIQRNHAVWQARCAARMREVLR